MTGEEILNLVRFHSGDHQVSDFNEINRALRDYCQTTGFPWLRELNEVAFVFRSGVTTYALSFQGLRRINFIWTRDPDDLHWYPVEELTSLSFEEEVARSRNADGSDNTNRPKFFALEGADIRVTPTPDQDYAVRVDGIVSSPMAEWSNDLPGPADFHEGVALLAAAFVLQGMARDKMVGSGSESEIGTAQGIGQIASGFEQRARAMFSRSVRDNFPNRLFDLRPTKTPIAR